MLPTDVLNLSGRHVHLGEADPRRGVASLPRHSHAALTHAAIGAGSGHIETVVDVWDIERVFAGMIRRRPIASSVVRADDVALAGLLQHHAVVGVHATGLDVDVLDQEVRRVEGKRSRPQKLPRRAIVDEDPAAFTDHDADVALLAALDVRIDPVSYTHLRAHETPEHLVCRLLLEKK